MATGRTTERAAKKANLIIEIIYLAAKMFNRFDHNGILNDILTVQIMARFWRLFVLGMRIRGSGVEGLAYLRCRP